MDKVKKIFIATDAQETRVAVTEDKRLEEFYAERKSDQRVVGSIYKGRIASVVPGIGAAFVDIGIGKNGFLYVSDIVEPKPDEDAILEGEKSADQKSGRSRTRDRGRGRGGQQHHRSRIEEVVKQGQEILVQVVKEPFGTKGARLTTHLSLPGRYMVLMCNDARLGVSKRIESSQERARLRELIQEIRFSDEAGLIVRTAGAGKDKKALGRDVRYLSGIYTQIKRAAERSKAPACVYQEQPMAQRVLRDTYTEDVQAIVVDSKAEFHRIRRFLQQLIPGVKVRVERYGGTQPLMEKEGLDDQIASLFDKRVDLPSGGSIIIEPTEGLVAIDVNTAKFTGRRNLEETAFQVDKEAAIEVARQLRLRDVGGIVVIDFIDLDVPAHRRELVKTLEQALERDRAKTNLVSFSDICVAEITRQRMRRSFETVSYQSCPYCGGRGSVKSVLTVAIDATRQIRQALNNTKGKTLEVFVHPQVAVHILQQERATMKQIESQSKSKILVLSDPSLHVEEVKVQVSD